VETAASLMRDPITVPRDAAVEMLARRLQTHTVRHLPVVDGGGRLIGMVTDQDVFALGGFLLDDWVPFDEATSRLTAETISSSDALEVHLDAPLSNVLRLLAGPGDCAVVIDEARQVRGILTEHDGVRFGAAIIPAEHPIDLDAARPVASVRRDTPARVALDRMLAERVRHIVIEDGGRPVGVLSFRDLIIEGIPGGRQLTSWEVVRSTTVHTVDEGTPLRAAAERLAALAIGCLPVTDANGMLTAILTRTDIIHAAATALEEEALFGEG
jgi:CBS domain-containing protein